MGAANPAAARKLGIGFNIGYAELTPEGRRFNTAILVAPDDAEALAWGLRRAIADGPLPDATRRAAGNRFTVAQSVDALLEVFGRPRPVSPATIVRELEELIAAPAVTPKRAVSTAGVVTVGKGVPAR